MGISLTQNPGFASMELELCYDIDALKFVSYQDTGLIKKYGGDASDSFPAHSDNMSEGTIHFSWNNNADDNNSNKATGKIASVTFEVLGNAPVGKSSITVSHDGTLVAKMVPKSGTSGVYIPKALNYEAVDGSVTVTKASSYLVGDVNGNGVVNSADFTILSRYVSGWEGYAEKIKNMDAADINGNGKVNSADFTILSRYVSGWVGYDQYFVKKTK